MITRYLRSIPAAVAAVLAFVVSVTAVTRLRSTGRIS